MELHRLMKIDSGRRVVALAGGGGKTTALYALSEEAAAAGKKTVIMTTTHIGMPRKADIDFYAAAEAEKFRSSWSSGRVVAVGRIGEDGRVEEPDRGIYDIILREAQAIYIEADGSKRLPLKYPDYYEPALPGIAEQLVVICGLSALDKPFDGFCHRAGLARAEVGIDAHLIDEGVIARILYSGYGKFDPIVVLNQADTEELGRRGQLIAEQLYLAGIKSVSILSLHKVLGIRE